MTSLPCYDLVGYLGYILTSSWEIPTVGVWSHKSELHAFAEGQRVRIVKHVGLVQPGVTLIDGLDSDVSLSKPLSLDVDSFLRVSLPDKVLAHQI